MDGVVVAVGFSGHGFKMASSLGAVAADLISEGSTNTHVSFVAHAHFVSAQHMSLIFPWGCGIRPDHLVTSAVSYALGDLWSGRGRRSGQLPRQPGDADRLPAGRHHARKRGGPGTCRHGRNPRRRNTSPSWRSGSSSAISTPPRCGERSSRACSPARSPFKGRASSTPSTMNLNRSSRDPGVPVLGDWSSSPWERGCPRCYYGLSLRDLPQPLEQFTSVRLAADGVVRERSVPWGNASTSPGRIGKPGRDPPSARPLSPGSPRPWSRSAAKGAGHRRMEFVPFFAGLAPGCGQS